MKDVPQYHELMWPTLNAIKELGGSASNKEIVKKVMEQENFSDEIQNKMHRDGPITQLEYRMAWAKTYLKKYGALENSERGVWSITDVGENLNQDQMPDVVRKVRKIVNENRNTDQLSDRCDSDSNGDPSTDNDSDRCDSDSNGDPSTDNDFDRCDSDSNGDPSIDNDIDWKANLLAILQNQISPSGFERLVQRILRESGFVEVEVTGKAGDGGIDGCGILKIGLLSFRTIFQCKRYKGTVGPNYIRDFRGAMQGRATKGLFMTTGSFTSAAKKEALRDGAPIIDLFEGSDICELLKSLRLGVEIETQESVILKSSWFQQL